MHIDIASAIIKADKLKEAVFVTFGEAVKDARTKLGFSQQRFAEELGVSFSTVNRWEQGYHIPNKVSIKAVQNLCRENGFAFLFVKS